MMGAYSEQALQLPRKMQQQSVEPDVISCSSTISTCVKGAQPEQALQLREIQRRSVEPNVISYNAAISACEGAAQLYPLFAEGREGGGGASTQRSTRRTPRPSWTWDPEDAEIFVDLPSDGAREGRRDLRGPAI